MALSRSIYVGITAQEVNSNLLDHLHFAGCSQYYRPKSVRRVRVNHAKHGGGRPAGDKDVSGLSTRGHFQNLCRAGYSDSARSHTHKVFELFQTATLQQVQDDSQTAVRILFEFVAACCCCLLLSRVQQANLVCHPRQHQKGVPISPNLQQSRLSQPGLTGSSTWEAPRPARLML